MDALATIRNPFRDAIVPDAWHGMPVDVPKIHAKAFRICCKALDEVRLGQRSSSVLMHGEAGAGKTHLLGRLRQYWMGDPEVVDPIRPEVIFVAVRLQTGRQRLWRYLRRSVVEDLLRPARGGIPQLERILLRRLAEIRPADADLRLWWEWLRHEYPNPVELERVLDDLFCTLDEQVELGRDLCRVLGHRLLGRHRRDAKAWLLGDPLPESALETMDLAGIEEPDDLEDQARRMVMALCRLAGSSMPVVLCFDQIEAMQIEPDDKSALFAFGQLVMSLFQQTSNTLLISCIQSAYLDRLHRAVGVAGAAWDRLAIHQTALNPLLFDDAAELICARMQTEPELARLRAQHAGSRFWPLDEARLHAVVGAQGATARAVLSACAGLLEQLRPPSGLPAREELPVESSEPFLAKEWQERLEQATATAMPEQADAILAHGLPLLVHTASVGWKPRADHHLRDIDVLLEGPEGRAGVSLCNHQDLRGLWRRLDRLNDLLAQKKVEKLVLLRDARLPIRKGAVKAQKLLATLEAQGAQFLRPSAEALAALDALRRLLSDARAGDLANGGQTVAPETVEQWLAAHLPTALQDLLDEIVRYPGVGGARAEPDLFDRLTELLEEQPVVSIDEAAAALGLSPAALKAHVYENREHVGLLDGPPAVLFRLVAE